MNSAPPQIPANASAKPADRGDLAVFAGAVPPTPAWFTRALSIEPERGFFDCDGAAIELLTWGQVGKPGLLFLHGNGAHADWWSFIAPFFAEDWRCAAISWSGMGRSGHRAGEYTYPGWAGEAIAAIDAARLDAGGPVMIVAHSMGGYPALEAAARDSRFCGVISIDSALLPQGETVKGPLPNSRPLRPHDTVAAALARFRTTPATVSAEPYALDYVARAAMVEITGDEATEAGPGWYWRFDPRIFANLAERNNMDVLPADVPCPLALVVGAESPLLDAGVLAHMRKLYPATTPIPIMPGAGHHIMLEQPLALVSVLRSLLACWPKPGSRW